jgi:uncharacterized RDD family membrane protein YckC
MNTHRFWRSYGMGLLLACAVLLPIVLFVHVPRYRSQMEFWQAGWAARLEEAGDAQAIREVSREMRRDQSRPVNPSALVLPLIGGFVLGCIMIWQARRRSAAALDPTPALRTREQLARFPSTRFRTFWPRFWAYFLDGFAIAPVTALLTLPQPAADNPWRLILQTAISLVYWAYAVWLLSARGQTVGRWLCRVQVRDVGEGPVRPRQALIRESIPQLIALGALPYLLFRQAEGTLTMEAQLMITIPHTLWVLLEIITMLSNEKRRALHDYLARTVVVRVAD